MDLKEYSPSHLLLDEDDHVRKCSDFALEDVKRTLWNNSPIFCPILVARNSSRPLGYSESARGLQQGIVLQMP